MVVVIEAITVFEVADCGAKSLVSCNSLDIANHRTLAGFSLGWFSVDTSVRIVEFLHLQGSITEDAVANLDAIVDQWLNCMFDEPQALQPELKPRMATAIVFLMEFHQQCLTSDQQEEGRPLAFESNCHSISCMHELLFYDDCGRIYGRV